MKKILLLLIIPTSLLAQKADQIVEKEISQIAFGSCSMQDKTDLQLWKEVNHIEPDMWIWLGDDIYGDTEDMEVMKEKYNLQKSHPEYQKLISNTHIIGIWDDHDFGVNDGGKEYPQKDESKEELFRFLEISEDHIARNRKGAYQSYLYKGSKNIKVILLDARYFRDPLKKNEKGWNIPDEKGEVLGLEQWTWLEEQLQDEEADFFIIASGIQIIPEEHRFEKWANFPTEREKLLAMIRAIDKPLVLLSGDRHISETSVLDIKPYSIYEFTSSSLTNPWSTPKKEANKYRQKDIVFDPNFANMNISWSDNRLTIEVNFFGKDNKVLQTHVVDYQL